MNLTNLLLILIVLSIVSGHITHIMVTAVIFEGLRKNIRAAGERKGGFWAYFSKGYHCQLCSGVWYASIISLLWTIGLRVLYPTLWEKISGHPIGWASPFAWIGLYIVQAFFIAAIGHLFREIVGLLEDQRTLNEEEAEVLSLEAKKMDEKDRAA